MKQFVQRRAPKEEEDAETDEDEENFDEVDYDDDNEKGNVRGRSDSPTTIASPTTKTTTTSRVALPRDCGYHLHSYQITLEHPSYFSCGSSSSCGRDESNDGGDYGTDNDGDDHDEPSDADTEKKSHNDSRRKMDNHSFMSISLY